MKWNKFEIGEILPGEIHMIDKRALNIVISFHDMGCQTAMHRKYTEDIANFDGFDNIRLGLNDSMFLGTLKSLRVI